MIVSLFGVMVIFLGCLAKSGASISQARVFHDAYEPKIFPIHIEIANDSLETKWSVLVSRAIARFIKNIMDCSPGDAGERLEDSKLHLTFRTEKRKTALKEIERLTGKVFSYFHENFCKIQKKPWWPTLLRRWNVRPLVEIGPGAFKHDIVNFPPETLGNDMKKLVALQKRLESRAKDLNEGKENQ